MPKRGRPRKSISREQVEQEVIQNRLTKSQIATKYGVSVDTIERRMKEVSLSTVRKKASSKSGYENFPPQQQVEAAEAQDSKKYLLSEVSGDTTKIKYIYNDKTDSYITFLRSAPEPVVVSGSDHRAMCSAYSNWDGIPSTINDICRQFEFPRPWLIEYKTIHGWTHDKEPFSSEELMSTPVEALAEVALQKKRQSLFQQFEILKWKDTQADADKWRHLDQSVMKPLVETIERYVPDYRPPLLPMPKSIRDPFAIVMNVMDLHFAKHAWTDIAGQTYSKAQCEDLLIRHTSDLIVKLAPYGRPDVIYIPVGSDWNHVDTLNGETTHGTPQDMDGLPENMEFEGKMLAVKHIDLCRQIAPVILVFCPGNHDEKNSLSLLHFLFAWYKDAPDVEVRIATQPRQYVSYGDNLFGFVHGNDEKVTQLASLMASEARTQWGQTKNSFWFTGHLHHEVVRELDGITTYQVNSLSPADRWHAKKGFVLSRRALHAYLIDRHDGVVGQFTSVVKSNDLERPVGTFGFKMSTQARLGAAA